MTLLLLSLLSTSSANDGNKGFGIWEVDPTYTQGNLAYFLEIYVDDAEFASQVEPKTAAEGTGELHIRNNSTTFEFISINGVKVGRLGPLTTAKVKGLKAGTYDVTIAYPHGFEYTTEVATVGADGPQLPLKKDPNVKPVEMPTPDVVPTITKPDDEAEEAAPEKKAGEAGAKKQ
ncbi:MAG: hypothetical protein GY913_00425 [Proteobacteria bacterium]|nr:hypothetical protein [Pseudomonadota bacterium]MCP4915362.1 hypothetical protein [Pseudomonadota bacterium]